MQVENVIAFVTEEEPAGLEIRINFGVFAGRDATAAELEELGKLLVPEAGEVSIVGEQRHEISEDAEILLHQVRVSVSPEIVPDDPGARKELCERLVTLAEIWTRQCLNQPHAEMTDLQDITGRGRPAARARPHPLGPRPSKSHPLPPQRTPRGP